MRCVARLRAAARSASGTLRSTDRIAASRSLNRERRFIDMPTGVLGFFVSPTTTP